MITAVVILIVLVAALAVYEWLGRRADVRLYPPPGRLVCTGTRRMHLRSMGKGSPAVILESGISSSCLNWTGVQKQIAQFTEVVSYDRAGLGWSDAASEPRTPRILAGELAAALQAAKIQPPFVLVAHSFGAFITAAFAERFADSVTGIVLVDPLRYSEWSTREGNRAVRLRRGVQLSRRGAVLARIGIVRFALAMLMRGGRLLPSLTARAASGKGSATINRLIGEVRKMPEETWPLVAMLWRNPKSFSTMADYLEQLPESSREAALLRVPPDIPITTITGGPVECPPGERQIVAERSGHWVHLDEPEIVVEAVREMVEGFRAGPRA